jgi:hypothetical protein
LIDPLASKAQTRLRTYGSEKYTGSSMTARMVSRLPWRNMYIVIVA